MTKGVQTSEFFPEIGKINYEGRESDHIFSYKFYDEDQVVGDKTMKDHLRFAVAYWHSFCNENSDPFGAGTRVFPWNKTKDPLDNAKYKLEAAFEFFTKLGVPYYCFHDIDIAPEGDTVAKSEKNLQEIVQMAKSYQKSTGIKLLWGTANLFSHPRYMNGASTNPDFEVVCHAGAQVKAALEATVELGGENYVFWGGREGYASLINTNMKRELDHMGHFLRMARDYGRKIGFKGNYLIEPKPAEPSKHQYDFDSATVIGFLKAQGLADDFKINVEQNHAILAGHTFAHDLQTASDAGMLGSVDANMGDVQNGWDTDYFPTDLYDCIHAMMVILQQGGIAPGGLNFDAKVRRTSSDSEDLFIAHIAGMDAFARGLLIAHDIIENSDFMKMKNKRYASFDSGKGAEYEAGKLKLEDLKNLAEAQGEPKRISGKIELFEMIVNNYIK
ncbi:xylose isomerase [Catalinimonas niigatensis]|uniref:xylose isomerase n=1 Tax=Catalinimonas niigatensis TaxID=1397264 RepID=UPI0026662511|nr:xylose isomerase [Catalinimonas niigatensis]WPP48388.1 xylose isomerase [Catalinimonas niigatensis]